jgi:hypothetical protein
MALRSLTEAEIERARTARTFILIARWKDRKRLTRSQIKEIRPIIGEEEYAKALAELNQPR